MPGLFYSSNKATFKFSPSGSPNATNDVDVAKLRIYVRPDGTTAHFGFTSSEEGTPPETVYKLIKGSQTAKIRWNNTTDEKKHLGIPINVLKVGSTEIEIILLVSATSVEDGSSNGVVTNFVLKRSVAGALSYDESIGPDGLVKEGDFFVPDSDEIKFCRSKLPQVPLLVQRNNTNLKVTGIFFDFHRARGFVTFDVDNNVVEKVVLRGEAPIEVDAGPMFWNVSETLSSRRLEVLKFEGEYFFLKSATEGFVRFYNLNFDKLFTVHKDPTFVEFVRNVEKDDGSGDLEIKNDVLVLWQPRGSTNSQYSPARFVAIGNLAEPTEVQFYCATAPSMKLTDFCPALDGKTSLPLNPEKKELSPITFINGLSFFSAGSGKFGQMIVVPRSFSIPSRLDAVNAFFPFPKLNLANLRNAVLHPRIFPWKSVVEDTKFDVGIGSDFSPPDATNTRDLLEEQLSADDQLEVRVKHKIDTEKDITGLNILVRGPSSINDTIPAFLTAFANDKDHEGTTNLTGFSFIPEMKPLVFWRGNIPSQSWSATAGFATVGVLLTVLAGATA